MWQVSAAALATQVCCRGRAPRRLGGIMGAFARHVPCDLDYGAGGRGRAQLRQQTARWWGNEGDPIRRVLYLLQLRLPNAAPTSAVSRARARGHSLLMPPALAHFMCSTHREGLDSGGAREGCGARHGEGEDALQPYLLVSPRGGSPRMERREITLWG